MNSRKSGRRRLLKQGATVAGLAVGAIRAAQGQTSGSQALEVRPNELYDYGTTICRFLQLLIVVP